MRLTLGDPSSCWKQLESPRGGTGARERSGCVPTVKANGGAAGIDGMTVEDLMP